MLFPLSRRIVSEIRKTRRTGNCFRRGGQPALPAGDGLGGLPPAGRQFRPAAWNDAPFKRSFPRDADG
jgi:hypothetical protein